MKRNLRRYSIPDKFLYDGGLDRDMMNTIFNQLPEDAKIIRIGATLEYARLEFVIQSEEFEDHKILPEFDLDLNKNKLFDDTPTYPDSQYKDFILGAKLTMDMLKRERDEMMSGISCELDDYLLPINSSGELQYTPPGGSLEPVTIGEATPIGYNGQWVDEFNIGSEDLDSLHKSIANHMAERTAVMDKIIANAYDEEPIIEKITKCECGSEKVRSNNHSAWCPKYV